MARRRICCVSCNDSSSVTLSSHAGSFPECAATSSPSQILLTATYAELLAQKRDLDEQINKARKAEAATALDTVKQLIKEFDFTAQQVFPWTPDLKKVPANYHDPQSGSTWTGRGLPPKWIAGKDREQFLIR